MSPVNEFGQVVGEPVVWSPRAVPGPVVLRGRYVRLEPVTAAHAPGLFDATRDPSLWTYRTDDPPESVDELVARTEAWAGAPDTVTFAIVPLDIGHAVGVLTLCHIDPANGSVEVGAVLLG